MFLDKINNFPEESRKMQKLYSSKCTECNGNGLVNGEKGYVTCNCVKRANIHARLICNGLPKKYISITWDKLSGKIQSDIIEKAKDYCDNIEENIWDGKSLFLSGNNKNNIMLIESAISNDIAYKKNEDDCFYNILIISAEELMQTHNSSKNSYEIKNKFNKIINTVDILFINYLGEEVDNRGDITSKFINDLLTKRSFDSKVTIISSSLDMEAIANKYGINFISTIKQNYKPIKIVDELEEIKEAGADNGYY